MHTTRRHPTVFSGNRTKRKKSREQQGAAPSKQFLSVIIREKIQRLFSSLLKENNMKTPVQEKP
jgi:hypothetical protein